VPRPTSPIEEAGPLNGKTPPILISVGVTPGASAAREGIAHAQAETVNNAQASLTPENLDPSLGNGTGRLGDQRPGGAPLLATRCPSVFAYTVLF
jgi:hypothetical protein